VALHGIHQRFDFLPPGFQGSCPRPSSRCRAALARSKGALDQRHSSGIAQLVQLPALSLRVKRCWQRLSAGEHEPRFARPQ